MHYRVTPKLALQDMLHRPCCLDDGVAMQRFTIAALCSVTPDTTEATVDTKNVEPQDGPTGTVEAATDCSRQRDSPNVSQQHNSVHHHAGALADATYTPQRKDGASTRHNTIYPCILVVLALHMYSRFQSLCI